jgi:ATP-binding cassette subfamily F protein 3
LDEPTNNLDSKSIEWLIDYIDNSLSLVFIVSHDKYFLNQVTNKTLELGKNEIKLYSGNYDFYELEKSLEENKNDNEYLEYVEKYKKLKEDLNKEYSKVSGTNKIDRSLSLPRILM